MYSRFLATLILLFSFSGLNPNSARAEIQANATSTANIGPGGRPVGQSWSRSPVYAANGMA
ncbi:MAG: hypothetical protein VXX72_05930, partial [Pseudomonadota bacterium]|nr:hypothetical protein [Pseudomonadota bacterium]